MAADLLAFFSQDDFDGLDFDDLASLDKAQRQAVLGCMDQIFDYVFRAIGYQHIVRPKDVAFRRDLRAWGYSRLAKATPDNAHLDRLIDSTAIAMEHFYPSACHQAKMCMGAATGALIWADDVIDKGGLEQLQHFSQRYLRGLPQPQGLCAALADAIRDCDTFYGSKNPRGGSFSVMGSLVGVDGFCEEARLVQQLPGQFTSHGARDQRTKWSAEKLPYYIRNRAGLSDFYMAPIFKPSHDVEVPADLWISGIPDLQRFILLANDLFSFSKETLALENFNYFSLLTRTRRQAGRTSHFDFNGGLWTVRDTLYEAVGQLLSCVTALDSLFISFSESLSEDFTAAQSQAGVNGLEETDQALKMNREKVENARVAAEQWREFRQGYIAFHINCPRYRLNSMRAKFYGTVDTRQMTATTAPSA